MAKPKKKTLALRKRPTQHRSRDTVDLIVSTASEILEARGYANFSTAAVAKRTGVSIGTLYQYFPNKESLAAAVIECRSERELKLFQESLVELKDRDFGEIFPELVRRHLAFHRERPDLQRIIVEEIPKAGGFAKLREFESSAVHNLARFLRSRSSELRVTDFDLAAFLVVYAFKWVARTIVTVRPEFLDDPHFERELTDLLLAYLGKTAHPQNASFLL